MIPITLILLFIIVFTIMLKTVASEYKLYKIMIIVSIGLLICSFLFSYLMDTYVGTFDEIFKLRK